jgi:hypothetical protein
MNEPSVASIRQLTEMANQQKHLWVDTSPPTITDSGLLPE